MVVTASVCATWSHAGKGQLEWGMPVRDVIDKFVRFAILFALCGGCIVVSPFLYAQNSSIQTIFIAGIKAQKAGHLAEAAKDYEKVTRLAQKFPGAYMNLGLVRTQQLKPELAIVAFKKAIALDPSLKGAHLFLGIEYYRMGKLHEAAEAIAHEIHLSPRNAQALMWMGVVKLGANQPVEAARYLDKAAAIDPTNVNILYHRATAHFDIAKQSYERMFKLNPHSMRVHEVLGEAYARSGQTKLAVTEYKKAIRIAPSEPGLHQNLGDLYWKEGEFNKAEEAYKAGLAINPYNSESLFKLGSLLANQNHPHQALLMLKRAEKVDPSLYGVQFQLGKVEAALGHYSQAVINFKKAIAVDKSSKAAGRRGDLQAAYYQLFLVYRKQHKAKEAGVAMAMFQKLRTAQKSQNNQALQKEVRLLSGK